jgi:hypothetical protein
MDSMTARPLQDTSSQDGRATLSLSERLGLISLIEEGERVASPENPVVADLFDNLWDLVDATVSGSKIDHLKPRIGTNGFQVIELNSETGDNLGRLNMLYLKKPIPCYYLVYVEVAAPFRNKGLGNRILKQFADFLCKKGAVGLLDNIIPLDDPACDIYGKLEWKGVEEITEIPEAESDGRYMVFVPPSLREKELRDPVRRLLNHIRRKRAVIDMRDNELMVQRTIEEFKEVYKALTTYFGDLIAKESHTPLMRYMFSRFVTRFLNFRRRIAGLLGYTGGESLDQVALDPFVRSLPLQSYAPRGLASNPAYVSGNRALWMKLPETLKKHPARIIESLPNYRRPSLVSWLEAQGRVSSDELTLGDLMDLGYDPTRLKELCVEGNDYIVERVQARLLPQLQMKNELIARASQQFAGTRVRNAPLRANPVSLFIRDRGNVYLLRNKVEGIHWDEAVAQLQTRADLKRLNAELRLDGLIAATVSAASDLLESLEKDAPAPVMERVTWFVAWDLGANRPMVTVDGFGASLHGIWLS